MFVLGPRGKPSGLVVLLSEAFNAGAVSKAQRSLEFLSTLTDGSHVNVLPPAPAKVRGITKET